MKLSHIFLIVPFTIANLALANSEVSECFESHVRMSFFARDGYKYTPMQVCELKGIMNYSEYNHQLTAPGKAKAEVVVKEMLLHGNCEKFGEITLRLQENTSNSGSMEFVSVDEEGIASESISSSVYENEFSSSVALQSVQKIHLEMTPTVILNGHTLKPVSPLSIKATQGATRQTLSTQQKTTLIAADLSEVTSFQIDVWENKTSECSANEEFVQKIIINSSPAI